MLNKKIEEILKKFFQNTANPEELKILGEWVIENKSLFYEQIELHYLISGVVSKNKAKELENNLLKDFNKYSKKKSKRKVRIFQIAAIFIGIFTLYLYNFEQKDILVKPEQEEIIITLGDGSSKKIKQSKSSVIISKSTDYTARQEGDKIVYNKNTSKNKDIEHLVYNTLEVPYGKQFQIVLSDGTEVFLNSGSSLTYPVAFFDKGPRNIKLTGEAYFIVNSDSLRPFYVSTEFLKTEVLGTEFNITNYEEDESTLVVLVDGSLSVNENSGNKSMVLSPSQLATYSFFDKELHVKNVDISSYIAWKDGILLFKNEDFYSIAKKLERHFDVEIEISDLDVSKERFTGRFETETIEEVLKAFQRIKNFKFSITENKISINHKK